MKKITFLFIFFSYLNAINAQFIQNFDSGTTTPAGWSVINGGDPNTWTFGAPNSGSSYNGANVAKINHNTTTAHDDYLVTPLITVVAGVNDQLSFRVRNDFISYVEHFDVKIATTAPTNAASFTTTLMGDTAAPLSWTKISLDLTPYIGQSIYIGFHATSLNMYALYLDNIVSESLSVCTSSTAFTENFDANTSLPNCWSVINGGDGYTWTITTPSAGTAHSGTNVAQITSSSVAHDDYLITRRLHVVAGVNDRLSFWARNLYSAYHEHFEVKLSNTYTLTSNFTTTIQPDTATPSSWTKYTINLSAYVGQNIYIGFHAVSANQYALILDDVVLDGSPQLPPFPQDFDLYNSVPNQWSVLNTSNTNAWSFPTLPTSNPAYTGTNVALLTTNQTITQNDFLVTPAITITAGVNDRLSFRALKSYYNTSLSVKVATNNTSSSYFTTSATLSSGLLDPWALYSVDLSAYVGQTIYVGFSANSNSIGSTVSFDNFVLDRQIPSLSSNCHGYYDLTVQTPILLNGLNPAENTVTYYTSLSDANQGINTIANLSNFYFNFSTPTGAYTIFAKIYNTTTNTFSITHFNIFNGAVTFQFQVTDSDVYASITNSSIANTLQWYQNGTSLQGQNNIVINNLFFPTNTILHLEDTNNQNCTAISVDFPILHLNDDIFTVNMSNGITALTPSIINNEYFFNDFGGIYCSINSSISGITISQDGIISVATSVAPGQYAFSCTATLFNYTLGVTYILNQIVTIIVPVNGIKMNAFIDNNNNGIKDVGEVNFPKGKFNYIINNDNINNVIISPVGSCIIYDTGFTNSYDLSYEVDSEFLSNYSFANSSFNDITITGNGIQQYDFPITITNNYNDLSVTLEPTGSPRPGFHYGNKIAYTNNGTQTISSGTVSYTKGNGVTITNVSESGIVSNTNGFIFDFTNLLPFETRYITIDLLTSTIPTVTLGQLISNSASITMVANDVLPLNNSSVLNQSIVGSYDPNSKSEGYGGKIVYSSFTADDYLTYTIQFENTGTNYATFINLTDVLDTKLDENSIRMLDASHVYTLKRIGANLNWNFANIYLPPSVSGSDVGKGYVTFKIKPKPGYTIGDIIPNSANIYFDYNPAITTTVCTTEFVNFLNIYDLAFAGLKYFPNPLKNSLSISNSSIISQVEITSLLGQKIMTKNINELQTEINLSNLSNGIYFVMVKADDKEKTFRIVKE